MITQADTLLLLSPSSTTLDEIQTQRLQEKSLFTQLLAQIQDILEATPSQEGKPSPLPVLPWPPLERRLGDTGGIAETTLQATLSRPDIAPDEPERRALESLIESLHDILQYLAVDSAPACLPMPTTEIAVPENMSAQNPGEDIVACSQGMTHPSPSGRPLMTNAEPFPAQVAEPQPPPTPSLPERLPSSSASAERPQPTTALPPLDAAVADMNRQDFEDYGLERLPGSSPSTAQNPHQPAHPKAQGRTASVTGTASQLASLSAELPGQADSAISFTEPGFMAPVSSSDVRPAPADTREVSSPQSFSPLPPEAAAKILGHPLPRNTILLQLEPPELGHLQVQIHLTDERLTATFWADSPEVRSLLHTHFPSLNESLQDKGFQTHQISLTLVGDSLAGQNGQSSQRQPEFQFLAHSREQNAPPAQEHGNRPETTGSPSNSVTHTRLVDVVI